MDAIDLNGSWQLYGYLEEPGAPTTLQELRQRGIEPIEARVPGNVDLDLVRAGLEQDPFYGENLYAFEKYNYYSWWYVRRFTVGALPQDGRACLRLRGVDAYAEVYLNQIKLGETDDAFIEFEWDCQDVLRQGENELAVHIRGAMNVARRAELPILARGGEQTDELVALRKPPHCFGWDIAPRLLSAGLWRGVELYIKRPCRIEQLYLATKRVRRTAGGYEAELLCRYRFVTDDALPLGYEVALIGQCGDSVFQLRQPAGFQSGEIQLRVENAKLWWPKGYGRAALYRVRFQLFRQGELVCERSERIGLREITLERSYLPGDAGQFRVLVNHEPVLLKGCNHVPLDALHSRDALRLAQAHALFEEAGCNVLRCWGGNVYEDHRFFDLCDERGMLVWQDFALACASYPQDDRFAAVMEREAASVVRKLRNHPSLLLWAGDNEVDEGYCGYNFPKENRYNRISRELLPRVVRDHDPMRPYVASSPYIPENLERYQVPEQHNWGPRDYFKGDFYKHSSAHFISEIGYHGCPAPSSLAKFLPKDQLWPFDNSAWDTHCTENLRRARRGYSRNRLMAEQVQILFGSQPQSLERFAQLSQISQAEAKKFFIEMVRLKKWRRTGVIWWNMLDGWPQISDAVVDYYFTKKLAFHYIRRVQRPICLMMDEQENWSHALVLGNDSLESKSVAYRVEDGDSGQVLLSGEALSPANENLTLGSLRLLAGQQRLFVLRWTVDGTDYANHYISGFPPFDEETMLRWVERIRALPEPFDWAL